MCARRRTTAGKKPLEWVAQRVDHTAGGADLATVINLSLDDDEIAEVWQIESEAFITVPTAIVDDATDNQLALTMDPSVSATAADPYDEAFYEDLEVFYNHRVNLMIDSHGTAASVDQNVRRNYRQSEHYYPNPILLGTNIAMLTVADGGVVAIYWCRIFFTRKKAGKDELFRTLLKRR